MTADRVNQALARIEAASSRIEAAARQGEAAVAALAVKHEALRGVVVQSLRELDDLIGQPT